MFGKKIIALDIGGTSMRAAIVRKNKIQDYVCIPTPKNKNLFLKRIEELIEKFNPRNARGIGIGIASPVKEGVIKNGPNIPLKDFNLQKYLRNKFKKRIEIKNDAGCFALAELKLGLKNQNFILLTLGTGIGGGIAINGEEYRGTGYGAEFGHMYIRNRHWEVLWQETRKDIKKEFKDQKMVKELIKMDNKKSKKILEHTADYLGQGIASLISAFDPEAVLIGGGVRESGTPFLNLIKKKVDKYTFLPKKTPIFWTTLKHPGILGASLLID